jgi:hypothetical protein
LIPRALLQNPEGATAALEDLFRDSSEEPNTLQVKAEEAFSILIARKVVNNQVRSLPLPPALRAVRHIFLLTFDLIVTFPISAFPSLGVGTSGRKPCYCNHQGISEGRCCCESGDSSLPDSSRWTHCTFRWKEARGGVRAGVLSQWAKWVRSQVKAKKMVALL